MLSTIINYSIFAGFGLWLALFPNNVIRFYAWLYQYRWGFKNREFKPNSPITIRIIGILWVILFVLVDNFAKK